MPTIQELRTQRDTLLTQMQALALGKADAESRAKFDAINADVVAMDGDIQRLETLAKYEAEQRQAPKPTRSQPGQPLEGTTVEPAEEKRQLEKRAFEQYIRYGHAGMTPEHRQHLRLFESRDVSTAATGANGAALVPQLFLGELITAQKQYGPIATLVRNKVTNNNGAPIKVSLANDTANSLTILGETVAVTEVDPAFSGFISSTDTITTGLVKVSMQELDDSAFNLDQWLRDSFGKRWGRGIEAMITNGNGSNVAALVGSGASYTAVGNGKTQGGTSSVTGVDGSNSIGYADIVALYGALDPAYVMNASFVMNSNTRAYLLGVTNTFGQPLFIPNPNGGAFDTLLGRPVVLDQAMASIGASTKSIIFGDLSEAYLYRRDGDLAIIRLNERYMDQLEVGFLGYARIGGNNTVANSSIPPLVTLVQAAS